MIEVERSFSVTPSQQTVVDYLKDFANATEWDPGTVSCTQTSTGPVAVGTTWHNVSEFRGRKTDLTYRLAAVETGAVHLVGENKTVTSYDDITVAAQGSGSRVTYRARLDFHGLAKLATPILKPAFAKLADQTQQQMTQVLNKL